MSKGGSMAQHNPYVAPRAAVLDAPEECQPVRIFSVSGRIGRARFILYTAGLPMLIMFLAGGWFALLGLLPLVNLAFWFIPGTDGANRYGARTPPNGIGVLIGVWLVPALFIGAILAAVAIPAYQDYAKRAEQRR
jgi:hypothetical protein